MKNSFAKYLNLLKCLPIFLLGLFCFSCLDEIVLTVPKNALDSIMIRGKLIYGSPSKISVSISDLSDFVKFESSKPISGATVILKTDEGKSLEIPMQENGIYEIEISADNPAINIEIGNSYQIAVNIPDRGNYESTLEPLLPVPAMAAIHKNVVERAVLDNFGDLVNQFFIEFSVDTPLENKGILDRSFLKWDFEGAYRLRESSILSLPRFIVERCYFFDKLSLNKVTVFDGNIASQSILSNHIILEEQLDYRFVSGFYLNVIQQSLSEGAFKYWEQISKVTDLNGSFFEALPAKVNGNFRQIEKPEELVFGYFYATVQDSFRIYISAEEAKFPKPMCQTVQTYDDYLGLGNFCNGCLRKKGSTLEKPDFWVD